jgi:cysteine-rich repeat protein
MREIDALWHVLRHSSWPGRALSLALSVPLLLALSACPDDDTDLTLVTTFTPSTGAESTGDASSETGAPTTGDSEDPSTGPAYVCGDGMRDPGELCDDGNVDNTDGCLPDCTLAVCGDGFVQAGFEQCDDGNPSDQDNCVAGCYVASCGDGFTYAGVEECDDGNKTDGDGCTPDCLIETEMCGNGVVEGEEACDDGNPDNTDSCLDTCDAYSCGDGWTHAVLEECDDANPDDTDDCVNKDGQCLNASCGDGFVHTGAEDCDDGNPDDTDDCISTCKAASCGDGFVHAKVEVCDDGKNVGSYNGCNPNCASLGPRCGDSNLDAPDETCDDGNLIAGDGCDATCQAELPPECLGYTELKEPDRAVSFNDGPGKVTKCDKTADKWHRFLDPAGTVIPLTQPSLYSCGTDAPGYMLGDYPAPEDGIVNRTVCYPWIGEPCNWSNDVLVLNCGDYFVWQLPTPSECALRYCAAPLP